MNHYGTYSRALQCAGSAKNPKNPFCWVLQDHRRLVSECPDHVRQLLGWVGNNPRLLVAALSILSGQGVDSSPAHIFIGERWSPVGDIGDFQRYSGGGQMCDCP